MDPVEFYGKLQEDQAILNDDPCSRMFYVFTIGGERKSVSPSERLLFPRLSAISTGRIY